MGRVLSLDYMIQNSDNLTEDSYTIDLSSLVIKAEEKYDHILLIGAGDMIITDYILRYFNVKKITLVEIDDRVIENTKKYFKFYERIAELFIKEERLEVIIDDGAKYLRENKGQVLFDGIIIDNSDVYLFEGPAANLFTKDFYASIHESLRMGAFFSQQVSDEQVKSKWIEMVKSVGFKVLNFKYSITPEYSTALPLGSAMRD
jgi:spermidine synthase